MMVAASIWEWARRRPVRAVLGALLLAIFAFAFSTMARTPRLDRDWEEHLAVMPQIEMTGTRFVLSPAIDWAYGPDGPVEKNSFLFSQNYADLKNVWFMVEPQPGGDYAAHTLVLFEFTGDRIIGLTVEARREKTEDYDALQGVFNKFELAFIWSSAKDLLTRRAVFLKKDIYVYPLQLTARQKTDFLKALLQKTISVSTKPRFYNTITSNCTNELAKVARIPWHYSFILTGYAPQYLYELKYIPGDDFEAVKAKAKLDAEIRAWNDFPPIHFDRALLAELRKRFGGAEQGPQS